jgi:hypothetical protein
MWKEFFKISTIIALSGVKFLAGIPLSLAYHYSTTQTILFTSCGGILSLILFLFCSNAITRAWRGGVQLFKNIFSKSQNKNTVNPYSDKDFNVDLNVDVQYFYQDLPVLKTKRIFSKKSRMIVRLKLKYGLVGIAFLTPILLSVPVGTFIATKLSHNKLKIFAYVAIAIFVWSVALTFFIHWLWPQAI